MPRCETTRGQYAQEALSLTSNGNKSNVFCRPATPDQRCCSFRHQRHGYSWRREKSRGRSLYDTPPWEEIMKKCLLVTLLGLAISLALPTYAQQKDLADPQTTQKILAIGKAALEARNNHDPAAIAALYTRDAFFLRRIDPSSVGKPFRNGIQTCGSRGIPKTTSSRATGMPFTGSARLATHSGQPENLVRLGKAKPAMVSFCQRNLSQPRTIG
jgi:hypothetical protein